MIFIIFKNNLCIPAFFSEGPFKYFFDWIMLLANIIALEKWCHSHFYAKIHLLEKSKVLADKHECFRCGGCCGSSTCYMNLVSWHN